MQFTATVFFRGGTAAFPKQAKLLPQSIEILLPDACDISFTGNIGHAQFDVPAVRVATPIQAIIMRHGDDEMDKFPA
jgi:hypothetical protein